MNRPLQQPHRFFVGTRPLPCPYLDGRTERKVVTDLNTADAAEVYDRLSRAGFRRSHGLAYRPACPGCQACVPVRIVAGRFRPGKSLRRVANRNSDIIAMDMEPRATGEQFNLFIHYQRSRHDGGEMAGMTFRDFRAMVEDSPVDTRIVEFREPGSGLVAMLLADRQGEAMSAVYSIFEPGLGRRSLGSYMVLWLIAQAQAESLPYVYLGYWIAGSEKMAYKSRFRPLEGLGPNGWAVMED